MSRFAAYRHNMKAVCSVPSYAVFFAPGKGVPVHGACDALIVFKKAHKILFIGNAHQSADLGQGELGHCGEKSFCHLNALAVQVLGDGISAVALEKGGQIRGMIAEFFRDVADGEGGIVIELQPFHQVDDTKWDFLLLLHQVAAEKAFVCQFQQQSALGVVALHSGKMAQALGQIQ